MGARCKAASDRELVLSTQAASSRVFCEDLLHSSSFKLPFYMSRFAEGGIQIKWILRVYFFEELPTSIS